MKRDREPFILSDELNYFLTHFHNIKPDYPKGADVPGKSVETSSGEHENEAKILKEAHAGTSEMNKS